MKTLQQLLRLERLDQLIRKECTETPCELAQKIGVSRSTLYEMLGYLKEIGAEISYSRSQMTFYYTQSFQLKVEITVTALNNEEVKRIIGGTDFTKRTALKLGYL